ncbi:MAG: aminotransferase class I/II-fold pyridoxal phosphate-dependent enzyme [Anaerolineaceae bacterium]|nr:aminotransferase class I/II-fold pyridoxal phosphate-dependent enzyme [Anaerolineaceae bacterium]
MKYRRMPIEKESPEQFGYDNIRCNLTESSVSDMALSTLGLDLSSLVLAYTDHLGKPALRELIAADGKGLSPQDVLVTPSAAAALFIIATTLLEKGDHMVVMHPNYATNIETPLAIGCQIDYLRLSFENGFRFDIDQLAGLVRPETRLISLTTPHNPTGATLSEKDLYAAAALAEARGCYLLVDETYREMNFAGPTPLAAGISPRCISVASMSKSFGLPGIRMGWAITQDTGLQERFLAAKEQIFICNSVVDEEIAFHVLAHKDRFLPPIQAKNRQGFEITRDWMNAQSGFEWVEPVGGVVSFPRIRAGLGVDVDAFYRILNQQYSTFVGPGHWFDMQRSYMRLGYGWPRLEELREGLVNLSLALEQARTAR